MKNIKFLIISTAIFLSIHTKALINSKEKVIQIPPLLMAILKKDYDKLNY